MEGRSWALSQQPWWRVLQWQPSRAGCPCLMLIFPGPGAVYTSMSWIWLVRADSTPSTTWGGNPMLSASFSSVQLCHPKIPGQVGCDLTHFSFDLRIFFPSCLHSNLPQLHWLLFLGHTRHTPSWGPLQELSPRPGKCSWGVHSITSSHSFLKGFHLDEAYFYLLMQNWNRFLRSRSIFP